MKICVIGTGYVGLVAGACLAEIGKTSSASTSTPRRSSGCKRRAADLRAGPRGARRAQPAAGRLDVHDRRRGGVAHGEVVFIAVGTPPDEDGSADLRHVLAAPRRSAAHDGREIVVVTKSTVPVGTAGKVAAVASSRHARIRSTSCSNPEFLKEGAAVDDFMKPDRVVIGADRRPRAAA